MHKKFIFSGPIIILDVGGVRHSTSHSTLLSILNQCWELCSVVDMI